MDENRIEPILLPYQSNWHADESQGRIGEKSRQIGFTWGCHAAEAVYEAARQVRPMDQWYCSVNWLMAKEFILDVEKWARALNVFTGSFQETIIEDERGDILAFQVRFATGKRITVLTSVPTNFRGKRGHARLDEFAFHAHQEELIEAVNALLMWGGRVSITSTHNGHDSHFALLCDQAQKGLIPYSHHKVTFNDAVSQGLYRKVCESLGRPYSLQAEAQWVAEQRAFHGTNADQELDCIPRRPGGQFIKSEWLEKARIDIVPPHCNIYMAADFAVTAADLTGQRKSTAKRGEPDFTEIGVFAVSHDKAIYPIDWWSGQEQSDVWIAQILAMARKHKPITFFGEGGVIRHSIEPHLLSEMRRSNTHVVCEWLNPVADKATRAGSYRGLAHAGMIRFPFTPWADAVIKQSADFVPGEEKSSRRKDDKFDTVALLCRAMDDIYAGRKVTKKKAFSPYRDYSSTKDEPEGSWKTT